MDLKKYGLTESVESEIQAYIDELNSKYQSAKDESIKARKGKDEKINALQSSLDAVLERLGVSDVSELDSLPDMKGQAEAAKQFEAKLKRLERDLAESQKTASERENQLKTLRTDSALKAAMSQYQFIDDELVSMLVKSKLTVEGDEVLYADEKGAMLSLSDALAGIAKAKPQLLKANSGGGSGFVNRQNSGIESNPFAKDSWNMTKQIELKNSNPQLAEQLKAQATSN